MNKQPNNIRPAVSFKEGHSSTPPSWIITAFSLLIGIGTFISFLPALQNGFLDWDDKDNFLTNFQFRGLGAKPLTWMFTTYHMGPYQPLSWLSSAIDYSLWGMDPRGYHATNLLLHSVNAILFFILTRRLLALAYQVAEREWRITLASLIGALFFSVHPLRVESVAWATERRDVLSGLFFLAAALCYLQRSRKLSLLMFTLALLSKATAIGLLWGLFAMDIFPLRRLPLDPRRWWDPAYRPVLFEKIPYALLAAAAVINGMLGLSGALHPYPWIFRISAFFYGAVFYLQKTIWPGALSPLYELPARFDMLSESFAIHAALALLITIVLFILRRRYPAVLVAWGYYLLTLAPVSGLAQNGPQLVASRYSYLACMPYAILVAAGFAWAWDAMKAQRWLLASVCVVVLVLLGSLSWSQTQMWKDDMTLWGYAVRLDPTNSRALTNLGADYAKAGKMDDALGLYERALQFNPDLGEAHRNRGLALASRGQLEAAVSDFQAAESDEPERPEAYVNLAAVYLQAGRAPEAIDQYQMALDRHTPHLAEVYSNLALAFATQGKYTEAIVYGQKAAGIRPELPQIHNNLASALGSVNRIDEAIAEARMALALKPDYAKAHYLLGNLLKRQGHLEEGNAHLQEAARLGIK